MNTWATVLVSIISSGAFSYLVTMATANRVKKTEFEWEYKRYILDKRKEAYQIIYKAFGDIIHVHIDKETRKMAVTIYIRDINSRTKIDSQLNDANLYKEWVTPHMLRLLDEINMFYIQYVRHAEYSSFPEMKFERYNQVKHFRNHFYSAYWYDIKNLHDIKGFLKSKERG